MASKAATVGDPRRPQEVKKVGAVTVPAPDDTISQTILIAAMSAGVSALMFQSKLMIWAGVFLTMAAYAHMPFDAPQATQLSVMVLTLIGWSAMQVYFKPLLGPRRPTESPPPSADMVD